MLTPIKAIRAKCLSCTCDNKQEVRECPIETCPLHPYRMGRKPAKTEFTPPEIEEVAAYCKERENDVDPEQFVDFYEARGWMVGRVPMKDWKAAVRTWERNGFARRKDGTHAGRASAYDGESWDSLTDEQREEYERIANDPNYR